MKRMPSPGLVKGVETNLIYWQEKLAYLSDEKMGNITRDHPNLLRAVEFGLVLNETHHMTAELTLQAFPFIERGGYWETWIPLIGRLLTVIPANQLEISFNLHKRLGQLFRYNGQLSKAIATHETAMHLAEQMDSPHAVADANLNLSEDHRLDQVYPRAEAYGLTALQTFTLLPEAERWLVSTLNTLGLIALAVGQASIAEERFQEAVSRGRPIEQPTYLARMLNNLALAQQAQGQFVEALASYQEALMLLATTISELDKSKVSLSLGSLYFEMNEWEKAEALFRQADSIALRQSGDTYLRAVLAQNLGNVLLKKGKAIQAEVYLQRSLLLWRSSSYPLMLANTLGTLAETLTIQNQAPQAQAAYDEALAILACYPDHPWARKLGQNFSQGRAKLTA